MKNFPIYAGLLIGVLGLAGVFGLNHAQLTATPIDSDFSVFRAGASFRGDISIYNPDLIADRIGGPTIEGRHRYPRQPWYSYVTYPLWWMTHRTAFLVWRALSAFALISAVLLWPIHRKRLAVAMCWSFPALWVLFTGQDVSFVFALTSLGVWLLGREKMFSAGLAFSLAASLKPHLLLLVFVAFAVRKLWRLLAGWIAGTAVLYLASSLLAGFMWPVGYFRVSTFAGFPHPDAMPGIGRMWHDHASYAMLCALAVTILVAFLASRERDTSTVVAIALACSLLIAPHSYAVDCILLLPLVAVTGISQWLEWMIAFAVSPIAVLLLVSDIGIPFRLDVACIAVGMALPFLRTGGQNADRNMAAPAV